MKYRRLGRTGIVVSEIGFGAWGIGGQTDDLTSYGPTNDATSVTALRRAFELGITFYDTASAYGNGHSERLIGEALRNDRSRVVICTKAGVVNWKKPPDFSPDSILSSLEDSLRRLRTDYVDVLMLHSPPIDVLRRVEIFSALEVLVASGKIRAWGISIKSPADAFIVLNQLGLPEIPVFQTNLNMMDVRAVDTGLLDLAVRKDIGIVARTPLCFGFLSGAIQHDTVFPPGDHRRRWSRAQLDRWILGVEEIFSSVPMADGISKTQTALRFCLAWSAVSTVIPGMLTPSEVEENAKASILGALPSVDVNRVIEINKVREFLVQTGS